MVASVGLVCPLSPGTEDVSVNGVLECFVDEACFLNARFSLGFEVIAGDNWHEWQRLAEEQERRIDDIFGPKVGARLEKLFPGSQDAQDNYTSRAHYTTDASSSSSEESDSDATAALIQSQTSLRPAGGAPQAPQRRGRHNPARVNEKVLTRELNAEIPVDFSKPYSCVLQRLLRRRQRARRPAKVADMSVDQLKEEKRSIKMELKNYDLAFSQTFKRAPQRKDKEPLREIYNMYKSIKSMLTYTSPPSQITPQNNPSAINSLLRPPVEPAVPQRGDSGPSSTTSRAELQQLKQEKKDLKYKLVNYQKKFQQQFNREVTTRKDREPMEAEYMRYRELKTLLRTLESQIT